MTVRFHPPDSAGYTMKLLPIGPIDGLRFVDSRDVRRRFPRLLYRVAAIFRVGLKRRLGGTAAIAPSTGMSKRAA